MLHSQGDEPIIEDDDDEEDDDEDEDEKDEDDAEGMLKFCSSSYLVQVAALVTNIGLYLILVLVLT